MGTKHQVRAHAGDFKFIQVQRAGNIFFLAFHSKISLIMRRKKQNKTKQKPPKDKPCILTGSLRHFVAILPNKYENNAIICALNLKGQIH